MDGHAVLANFVVISNRRFVPVEESIIEAGVKLTSEEEVRVFDVDVHHFFAETISSGKKKTTTRCTTRAWTRSSRSTRPKSRR